MAALDRAREALGHVNRSTALRDVIENAAKAFTYVGGEPPPAGVPLEAFAAAEQAAWLDTRMDRGEADRRLAAALAAAQPFIAEAERLRVLAGVVEYLEWHHADPATTEHFRSQLSKVADGNSQ